MKIAVIGAGPAGSYVAYLLAKEGFKTELFEQKKAGQVGLPVQCTGLLTPEIEKFLPLSKDFLVNTFSRIQVFSPNQSPLSLNKTEYLVERRKFDQHILDLALQAGVSFHPEHQLVQIDKKPGQKTELVFRHQNQRKTFFPDIVIGADGPSSLVYRYLNPFKKKTFYYGLQAVVKGSFEPSAYQVFFGHLVCPGLFAWLVPESSSRARVGLATLKNPQFYFNNFLKQLKVSPRQIREKQAGLIPIFDPGAFFHKENFFLLGDAASQVKATTLGGIIPAFYQAQYLTHCLAEKKLYQPRFKNLKLHLSLRKMLNKFSERDYDKLIRLLSKPKNKKILEAYSREKPGKLLKKLLLREPRLLYFAKHLF